ncbi:MAG: glycosyltransferase family 2 protein [Candidatus Moranbacteria bacterium]|nr:glycosyltransferase family 2 protein [Candidatus Moranbacteria bacterium]
MEWIVGFLALVGLSASFWAFVGIARYIQEKYMSRMGPRNAADRILPAEVAVMVPAYNEELCIEKTLKSLFKIVPKKNVYVGSDSSSDRTFEIAKKQGCNVASIRPNRGKAKGLAFLLKRFDLLKRYKAVIIVDADTEIDENYLKEALPILENPKVAAIAGHAVTKWKNHYFPRWSMFFIAYRVRLYKVLQAMIRYGQTWFYTNVTIIIPGFASIYKTSALKNIEIDAPGLIIEDFNMTFELHRKKLGKIGYNPKAFGACQDPFNLRDYVRQVDRWNLGFWQTVKRHGVWPSFFWAALSVLLIEMTFYGFFMLFMPFIFEWYFLTSYASFSIPYMREMFGFGRVEFRDMFIAVFAVDYTVTAVVAFLEKKPILLFYGLGFIFLRIIDAYMFITNAFRAFFIESDGTWKSPERRL